MSLIVPIVIPTKGRSKEISSHKYVDNSIICVSESEHDQYKEHNPDYEYVKHPDSIIGIAMKRQWIYDKFGDVFMMDDDLKGLARLSQKKGESQKLTGEQAYWIIQAAANMAKLTGCYLYGFNNFVRPEHYHGHTPFVMTGYINGCGLGMLKGAKHLKFNDSIKTNNDFYICGLNAYHYRKAFIDKRYCFNQDSFGDNIGGCAEVRTNKAEKSDYEILRMYFGNAIKLKTGGNTAAKHEHSKTLEVPF